MIKYFLSAHARDMLKERDISAAWVKSTLESPEFTEEMADGTVHYLKSLPDCGGRYLRIVVNPARKPMKVITAFLDRRLRRRS